MRTLTSARRFLAAALCLVVVGCSGTTSTPAPTPSPTAPTPARASDTQGRYRLDFELPQTDWHTTDSITGLATLSLVGTGSADFGMSGSGIVFSFDEVSGDRHVHWVMAASCMFGRLDAGRPITSPIKKSGGWDGDSPAAEFTRSFLQDPLVHLPAGDWTITAVADVSEGTMCSGASYALKAPVLVHVTEARPGV
jgi:hypothetical protein